MSIFFEKSKRMVTAGHTVFRRINFFNLAEYRSDLIAFDYMRRWVLMTRWGGIRIHHILRSDNDRHFHDHPMSFLSLILVGGYKEYRPNQKPRVFKPGSVLFRKAEDCHYLKLRGRTTWTFVLSGPYRRDWGFHTEDGWIPASDYDAYLERKNREIEAVPCDVDDCIAPGLFCDRDVDNRPTVRCELHRITREVV